MILVTGAGKRIGKAIAEELLCRGENLLLHVNQSFAEAEAISKHWNRKRPGCCEIICQDLSEPTAADALTETLAQRSIHVHALVNNASVFWANPILQCLDADDSTDESVKELQLWATNLTVNFFTPRKLIQKLATTYSLESVVNLVDIYAEAGLPGHTAYVTAKAGLLQSTRDLARQLAPATRVNSVSPGAILWPENNNQQDLAAQRQILEQTALKKAGSAQAIAKTVTFLLLDGNYITGQNIRVDGGRRLYI